MNEAFSTPFDREDIYRAIIDLDEVVNYCKNTLSAMNMLGEGPDVYTHDMAHCLQQGVIALAVGFGRLRATPARNAVDREIHGAHYGSPGCTTTNC